MAGRFLSLAAALLLVTGCTNADEAALPEAQEAELPDLTPQEIAQEALATEIDRLALDFGGTLGIAVVDVESGWSTGFDAERLLPQQSVSKTWVALTALMQADRGELDLSQSLRLTRNDLTVFHQPIRNRILREGVVSVEIEELIEAAITESDNTANDAVLNAVGGPEAVRAMLDEQRLAGIRFGPGERLMQSAIAGLEWRQHYAFTREGFFEARDAVPDSVRRSAYEDYLADPVDGATPQAIAEALARLARGDLLSAERTAWFLSVMMQTKSGPNRMKAAVPEGWRLAHKTGTGQYWDGRQSGYNDVGLLFAPGGRTYAVAIMVGDTRRSVPERMAMMQAVVRAVVAFDGVGGAE